MKPFIDSNGTFKIKIPATWKYELKGDKVHSFYDYKYSKSDVFQISITSTDTLDKKRNSHSFIKSFKEIKLNTHTFYELPEFSNEIATIKTWYRIFDNHVVCFTLTHSSDLESRNENLSIDQKVELVKEVILSFELIDPLDKDATIKSHRFDMFIRGLGATTLIFEKAVENNAFVEATCILANQIDALLRIGLILKKQLLEKNSEIETKWIYQGQQDKIISEKAIYKEAHTIGIINKNTLDELYSIYESRNRVVHRFIISEITLAEVEEISFNYYLLRQRIYDSIYKLETEQIKQNIGMTVVGPLENEESYIDYIKAKLGKVEYYESEK